MNKNKKEKQGIFNMVRTSFRAIVTNDTEVVKIGMHTWISTKNQVEKETTKGVKGLYNIIFNSAFLTQALDSNAVCVTSIFTGTMERSKGNEY